MQVPKKAPQKIKINERKQNSAKKKCKKVPKSATKRHHFYTKVQKKVFSKRVNFVVTVLLSAHVLRFSVSWIFYESQGF